MVLLPLVLTPTLFVKDLVQDALSIVCLTWTFPKFLSWHLGSHRAKGPRGSKMCAWSYTSTAGESISASQQGIVCFLYKQTAEKQYDPDL